MKNRHKCGYVSIHTMFAKKFPIGPENSKLIEKWGQLQISSCRVNSVHSDKGRVLIVAFDRNIGHAMWDHLLTYLPHWYDFCSGSKGSHGDKSGGDYPFDYMVLNLVESCLSKNKPSDHWYCQILPSIDAFGEAEALPVDGKNAGSTTLVETLLTLHLSLPRLHHFSVRSHPNKTVLNTFAF